MPLIVKAKTSGKFETEFLSRGDYRSLQAIRHWKKAGIYHTIRMRAHSILRAKNRGRKKGGFKLW